MKRKVCAAIAAVLVSTASVAGSAIFGGAQAVPDPDATAFGVALTAENARDAEHQARLAQFSQFLEQRRRSRLETPRTKVSPFAQLERLGLDGNGLRAAVEKAGIELGDLATFDLSRIDTTDIDQDERRCLTQAIYYEARNQSVTGQIAVADVVLNRVAAKRYPNTICDVVFQGHTRRTGCQFSFTCDGSMKGRIERRAMIEAQTIATAVLGGFRLELTGGATNYHANYVKPYWAPTLAQTVQVGDHLFYRRGAAPTRFAMLD